MSQGGRLFQISSSGVVQNNLRRLMAVALRFGQIDAFRRAVEEIDAALRTQADSFGEPKYPLPAAGLVMRLGAIRPLVVSYGVHNQAPTVFIARYRLLALPDS